MDTLIRKIYDLVLKLHPSGKVEREKVNYERRRERGRKRERECVCVEILSLRNKYDVTIIDIYSSGGPP